MREQQCLRILRPAGRPAAVLLLSALLLAAVLAGCGQRGDLYLPPPDERPAAKRPA